MHGDVAALRLSWMRSRAVRYSVHVFVVRGAMIDTGFPGAAHDVATILRAHNVRGALVTHEHEDHAGNVQLLAERGIPLAADDATLAHLRNPGRIGAYRHVIWRAARPLTHAVTPFVDETFALLHTPGHSDSHHAVWDHNTGTLFAGDLFLGVKVRMAHLDENPRALLTSLDAMVQRAPARVFCAHRGLVPNGAAALVAKRAWLADIIGESDRRMDAGENNITISNAVLGARTITHWFSAGAYSPVNFVRALRRTRAQIADALPQPHDERATAPPSAPHARR